MKLVLWYLSLLVLDADVAEVALVLRVPPHLGDDDAPAAASAPHVVFQSSQHCSLEAAQQYTF